MNLFDIFRKKNEPPKPPSKWDMMWEMWTEGKIASPIADMMSYDSEVNNGGHAQYFFNTANCSDMDAAVRRILPALPEPLRGNLARAYEAFAAQPKIDDDSNDDLFSECDDVFYKNEQLLLDILEKHADGLTL